MPIAVRCESCETRFRVPDSAAGGSVKCPKCAKRFTAPEAADASSSADEDQPARGSRPSSSAKHPVLAEAADDDEEGNDSSPRPTARTVKAMGMLVGIGASVVFLVLVLLWGTGAFSSSKPKPEAHSGKPQEPRMYASQGNCSSC